VHADGTLQTGAGATSARRLRLLQHAAEFANACPYPANIIVLGLMQGFLGFAPLFLQSTVLTAESGLIMTLFGYPVLSGNWPLHTSRLDWQKIRHHRVLWLSRLSVYRHKPDQSTTIVLASLSPSVDSRLGSQPIIMATLVVETVPADQTASALSDQLVFAVFVGATLYRYPGRDCRSVECCDGQS